MQPRRRPYVPRLTPRQKKAQDLAAQFIERALEREDHQYWLSKKQAAWLLALSVRLDLGQTPRHPLDLTASSFPGGEIRIQGRAARRTFRVRMFLNGHAVLELLAPASEATEPEATTDEQEQSA